MRRATLDDLGHIKSLVNHPEIRRYQSDSDTEIDPSHWFAPCNIILVEGDNCAVFLWRWAGIYEGHILFTLKGKEAEALARKILSTMLTGPAAMILAVVPNHLRHVRLFNRRLGFKSVGEVVTIEGPSEMFQLEAAQCRS